MFSTTLIPKVGLAIARILSLPISKLDTFKNKFVYISSFRTNQREILDAVQTVTQTTDADWKIEQADARKYLDEGLELMDKGEFFAGLIRRLYGILFVEGLGSDYVPKRRLENELLGLGHDDLVQAVSSVLAEA